MEPKKIKVREILELELELAGFNNGTLKISGLLNEKINIKTKYWLGKLVDQVTSEKQSFNKLREELIKKYGEETKDGGFEVKPVINDKPNPKLEEFSKEINELLDQEVELKFPTLNIESFDFESEYNYPLVLKYVIKDEE